MNLSIKFPSSSTIRDTSAKPGPSRRQLSVISSAQKDSRTMSVNSSAYATPAAAAGGHRMALSVRKRPSSKLQAENAYSDEKSFSTNNPKRASSYQNLQSAFSAMERSMQRNHDTLAKRDTTLSRDESNDGKPQACRAITQWKNDNYHKDKIADDKKRKQEAEDRKRKRLNP